MMQAALWTMAAAAATIAGLAALADRRRARRADLDSVGWVPWPAILMLAIITAALCIALAIRN